MVRCRWADPNSEIYLAYHDREWGRPEHDDRKLFEMLTLEGFQAGLSWLTILKKREAFHTAFDSFDPAVVAGYGPEKVEVLMADAGIVRNRAKIQARHPKTPGCSLPSRRSSALLTAISGALRMGKSF